LLSFCRPHRARVNSGKFVLAQLLEVIHPQQFQRCVARFDGDYKVSQFSCWSQFVCMAFAQLTWRESLRDIEACLNSRGAHLYHLGLTQPVRRSTLADANHARDWRIFAALAEGLLRKARRLYVNDPLQSELAQAVYAVDASVIDLGLHLCPWARFDFARASLKLHIQLDLRGPLPAAVEITPSRFQEVLWLDSLCFEPGAFYLLDRGYTDYARLHAIERARAWFVIPARRRMTYARLHSLPVAAGTNVRSDQIIQLTAFYGRKAYPQRLRRIRCYDAQNSRSLIILTNHFGLPAAVIGELYRQRWQVELFFKWIKQHLRIKAFYGRSENAVRTQIWVALCVYALVAIARKQAKSQRTLFEILQVLSVSALDKTPIKELVSITAPQNVEVTPHNQLTLFE